MESISNNLKRKSSRGDNFYNGSGGAHMKLQFHDSLRDRCKNYAGSGFLCFKLLLILFPIIFFFSYYPVIRLGSDGAMYYELSLPLIWLVVFDAVGLIALIREKRLFSGLKKKWVWLALPVFLTISVIWSANSVRGILTAGVLWLIYFAGYTMVSLKDLLKGEEFRRSFWKVFFGATLVICAWCLVQCILDLAGIPRECSLMCEGCTYRSFGFPHPNGFAVEPQFMGNLLLAPIIVMAFFILSRGVKKRHCIILFILVATLFLTFSRGAIYSFAVALVFMSGLYGSKYLTRDRKLGRAPLSVSRGKYLRAMVSIWATVVLAFVFTLNLQGVMAQVSPTNDTYFSGVAKVLNHLSLGIIDVRVPEKPEEQVVENPVENSVENSVGNGQEESYFDGYVAESTDVRMQLNRVALELWRNDLRTIMFGVGLGGAGQALYDNGLTEWPKEIVQNQYISLLLETGLAGVALLILTLVLAVRAVIKKAKGGVILTLMVAYGVSLLFFAGLPNALHVYLMPVVVMLLL